jgi:predicted enzyme related to lactoylglutathione lyase
LVEIAIEIIVIIGEQDMKFNGVHHINIKTENMERAVKFYEDILECEKIYSRNVDGVEMAFMKTGNTIFELYKSKEDVDYKHIDGVINHFALDVTDIHGILERCKSHGVKILQPVNNIQLDGNILFAFIEGPEKERIEFFEYI